MQQSSIFYRTVTFPCGQATGFVSIVKSVCKTQLGNQLSSFATLVYFQVWGQQIKDANHAKSLPPFVYFLILFTGEIWYAGISGPSTN